MHTLIVLYIYISPPWNIYICNFFYLPYKYLFAVTYRYTDYIVLKSCRIQIPVKNYYCFWNFRLKFAVIWNFSTLHYKHNIHTASIENRNYSHSLGNRQTSIVTSSFLPVYKAHTCTLLIKFLDNIHILYMITFMNRVLSFIKNAIFY